MHFKNFTKDRDSEENATWGGKREEQHKLKCLSYTTSWELKTFTIKHEHAGFTAMAAAELYNTWYFSIRQYLYI